MRQKLSSHLHKAAKPRKRQPPDDNVLPMSSTVILVTSTRCSVELRQAAGQSWTAHCLSVQALPSISSDGRLNYLSKGSVAVTSVRTKNTLLRLLPSRFTRSGAVDEHVVG
jgi:hypothetical protein